MNYFSFYKDGKALYCLIFTGLLLSFSSSVARNSKGHFSTTLQHEIHGIITDGKSPLPGVTVSLKNKSNSAVITDYNGQYRIATSPNDTLIVSFIGFKTALLPIEGKTKMDITLQYDTTSLQEVKVNAGYYSVKESERTGSIARVTSKEIEKQPINNPLAALQGRMSGVNIKQATGTPGAGFNIQIRGTNSMRTEGNAPLYVVDGVPYSSQSLGYTVASGSILAGANSPINGINPSDIESIEVLKDADATAIYGSRGANGVVLITTKKGKEGQTKLSLSSYSGFGKVSRTLKLMNTAQYLSMRKEAFANDGINVYPAGSYDVNGTWDQNRYTDWQKELIGGTALTQNIQTTISGGTSSTQYLVSGTVHKETTVFPGDAHYDRGAVHASIGNTSDNGRFKVNFSVNYTADKNILPQSDFSFRAAVLAPNAPKLYNADGTLNWENNTWTDPLASLNSVYTSKSATLIGNTVLSYKLSDDFQLSASLGYTDNQLDESRINPSTVFNPSLGYGSDRSILYLNNASNQSWVIEPQLNWKKNLFLGEIDILLGSTFQNVNSNQLAQTGTGFASNSLIYNLAAASRITVANNQNTLYKYQAFFGRLNYNWQGKYIVNITGRRDGSSRFGPENRYANFGAVGVAYVFSKENFLKQLNFLSFGKFRTSYGTTGNDQIGDYQFLDTYSVSGANYNGIIGLQPTRLFNPEFGWEVNKKFEMALELGFFNDRIFLTSAYYDNRSSNQLVGIPLPSTTGFSSIQANLDATVQNKGLEFELRTVQFKTKNFSWTSNTNLSFQKNKLLKFPNLQASAFANRYLIGQSLNIQKVYHYTGIDLISGLYTFEDYNSDGQITSPEDQKWIEDTTPSWFGGFSNQLLYKNWGFDFLFQFVNQKARNYNYNISYGGSDGNRPEETISHWPANGPDSLTQLYTSGANAAAVSAWGRYSNSSATISDASYIRLKTISVTYSIPSKTFNSAQVYLQGQNLWTLTSYKGADPENQSSFFIPPLRQICIGVRLEL